MTEYDVLIANYGIPAMELTANYNQKYDPTKSGNHKKMNLKDFPIVEINKTNYKQKMAEFKKLDLPSRFSIKRLLNDTIYVRVLSQDKSEVIAAAEIWTAEGAMKSANFPGGEEYDKSKTYLNDLVVSKKVQGMGLGTQITKYLVDKYKIGYLETFDKENVATKVYQKLGFKIYHVDDDGTCHMKR